MRGARPAGPLGLGRSRSGTSVSDTPTVVQSQRRSEEVAVRGEVVSWHSCGGEEVIE